MELDYKSINQVKPQKIYSPKGIEMINAIFCPNAILNWLGQFGFHKENVPSMKDDSAPILQVNGKLC